MSYQRPSTPHQLDLSQDLFTTANHLANDQHIPEFALPEPAIALQLDLPSHSLSPPSHLQQPNDADIPSLTIGLGISYTPPNPSARPPPFPYTDSTAAHRALLLRALVAQQRLLQQRDADPRAREIVALRQVVRERERALERAREAWEASDGSDRTFSWARATEPRGVRCVNVLVMVVRERERALERAKEALEVIFGRQG